MASFARTVPQEGSPEQVPIQNTCTLSISSSFPKFGQDLRHCFLSTWRKCHGQISRSGFHSFTNQRHISRTIVLFTFSNLSSPKTISYLNFFRNSSSFHLPLLLRHSFHAYQASGLHFTGSKSLVYSTFSMDLKYVSNFSGMTWLHLGRVTWCQLFSHPTHYHRHLILVYLCTQGFLYRTDKAIKDALTELEFFCLFAVLLLLHFHHLCRASHRQSNRYLESRQCFGYHWHLQTGCGEVLMNYPLSVADCSSWHSQEFNCGGKKKGFD